MSHFERFDFDAFDEILRTRAREIRAGKIRACGTDAFLLAKSAELIRRIIKTLEKLEVQELKVSEILPSIHAYIMSPSGDPHLFPSAQTPPKKEILPDQEL